MTGSPKDFRTTRQRRVVLEELKKFESHPSAEEIFEAVRRRLPRVSLGTIYRNLDVLAELGEINKLEFGSAPARFDPAPGDHYHIRCSVCGKVDNIPMPLLTDLEERISSETDYRIMGHRLEFYGLCLECSRHMVSPGLTRLMPHT